MIPNIYAMRKTLESLATTVAAAGSKPGSSTASSSKSSTTEQAINEIMSSIEPFEPVSKRRSVDAIGVPVPVPPPALKPQPGSLVKPKAPPTGGDKKKKRDSSDSSSSDSEGSGKQSSTIQKVKQG